MMANNQIGHKIANKLAPQLGKPMNAICENMQGHPLLRLCKSNLWKVGLQEPTDRYVLEYL